MDLLLTSLAFGFLDLSCSLQVCVRSTDVPPQGHDTHPQQVICCPPPAPNTCCCLPAHSASVKVMRYSCAASSSSVKLPGMDVTNHRPTSHVPFLPSLSPCC